MAMETSVQAISLIINGLVYGINSTPLVLPRFIGRLYSSLSTRYLELDILEKLEGCQYHPWG